MNQLIMMKILRMTRGLLPIAISPDYKCLPQAHRPQNSLHTAIFLNGKYLTAIFARRFEEIRVHLIH